jgi:hypothetical protein
MEKRGEVGLLETIVFVILNLIFFLVMIAFAYNAGSQTFVYEQAYAKQIVLLIDNAKPDMAIMMDVSEIIPIALKKNKNIEEVFFVDEKTNEIKVSLNPIGGYSYKYFSANSVNLKIDDKWLLINIGKKEN